MPAPFSVMADSQAVRSLPVILQLNEIRLRLGRQPAHATAIGDAKNTAGHDFIALVENIDLDIAVALSLDPELSNRAPSKRDVIAVDARPEGFGEGVRAHAGALHQHKGQN